MRKPLGSRFTRALTCALVAALAILVVAGAGGAGAASSSLTVTATIASHISLTNGCGAQSAWDLGTVLPEASATTATGAGVCRMSWGSNNDSASLSMYQADGAGSAMTSHAAATLTKRSGSFLNDVDAVNADQAWAVGGTGRILRKTLASGTTWNSFTSPTSETLHAVDVLNASFAVAVGDTGTVIRWNGTNWAAIPGFPNALQLHAVEVVSATNVFVGSGAAGMWRWNGSAWSDVTPAGATGIRAIDAFDANRIYAGGDGDVFYTGTGGTTSGAWTARTGTAVQSLVVSPWDTQTVWAGGWDGTVKRSTNGGTNWTFVTSTLDGTVNNLSIDPGATALATAVMYAAGQGTHGISRSTDGGTTWAAMDTGTANGFDGVSAVSATVAFGAGTGMAVAGTTTGTAWSLHSVAGSGVVYQDDMLGVDAAGGAVLMVGGRGTIMRSTDGGATWAPPCSPCGTTQHLRAIDVIDVDDAVAVGDNGTVLRTTNAGATWSVVDAGTTAGLFDVAAVSGDDIWIVGESGTMRRWNGGSWSNANSAGATQDLTAVSAPSSSTVFVAGRGGALLSSTDSGASWQSELPALPATTWVSDVSAVPGTTTAYATVWTGEVLKTLDGVNWTSTSVTSTNLDAVHALTPSRAVVSGSSGTLEETQDGTTWVPLNSTTTQHLSEVKALDANTYVIASASGRIFTRVPTTSLPDFAPGTNDWTTGGAFAVCLQTLTGTLAAGWTVDGGTCQPVNSDPWRAVPATTAKVATTAAGATGQADLVWGFRPPASTAPGAYSAGVVFEAVAPAVP